MQKSFFKFLSPLDKRLFALICTFLGGMGQGVVAPQLPLLLRESSKLALESGLSATVLYLGIFTASFFFAKQMDSGKVHLPLSMGLLSYALTLGLLSLSPPREWVYVLRFVEGISLSSVFISTDYLLGRLSPQNERGKWLTFYGVALSLGLLFGPLLTLAWATGNGFKSGPLLLVAFSSIVAAAYAATQVRLFAPFEDELPLQKSEYQQLAPLSAGFAHGALESALVAVLPVLAFTEFGVSPEICLVIVILSAAVFSVPWGELSDRIGPQKTTLFLLTLMMFGGYLTHGILFCVLIGAIAGGLYPIGFAWLLQEVPSSAYGAASGRFVRYYGLGSLIAPAIAGYWAQTKGASGLSNFISLLAFFTLFFILFIVRQKNFKKIVPLGLMLSSIFLSSCGGSCRTLDRLFGEPQCQELTLEAKRRTTVISAACSGSPLSRKVTVNCPASTGTTSQCTGISDGLPVIIILLPNNSSGSFTDSSGTVYSDCGTIYQDFFNNLITNISAVFVSNSAATGDRLNCNATGCSITLSTSCLSGWNATSTPPAPNGTASLSIGTSLLACVYIDNSSTATPAAPAAIGAWASAPIQITISGNLSFTSGWTDAY